MTSFKEKVKKSLGLDEDFKTHTEKKHEVEETVHDATPAEIAAHNALIVPPVEDTVATYSSNGATALPESAGDNADKGDKRYAVAGASADPHDKKLEHFQYTKDPNQLDYWEFGEDVNTMSVPKNIRDKYPEMRFHWRSLARVDRLGMGYKGWQKFTDPSLGYGEGLKRGNDIMLFAMPEERAQRYNDKVAEDSTQRVKELQEHQIEMNDRAAAAGLQPYEAKGKGTSGIAIGERPALGKRPAGQHRGLSREEVVERITHQQEQARKGRVTFDMGGRR
jgi:hypothetical protein